MADAAGAAVHQHLLPGAHVRAVDQPFPGRDDDQRQRRGLAHRQVGGLSRQQVGIDRGIFGQRSLQAADAAGHAVDLVARPRNRVTPAPTRLDDAGQVHARGSPATDGAHAPPAPARILVSSGLTPLAAMRTSTCPRRRSAARLI